MYKDIIEKNPDYDPAHTCSRLCIYYSREILKMAGNNTVATSATAVKMVMLYEYCLQNDDIAYKKILLRSEGGLGDTINFIRYAEYLKHMGADIIVACQKQLIPLLSRCNYIDQLIPFDKPIPSYDADATLMSLPAILQDDEATVPQEIPYIFADPVLIEYWQQQLAHDTHFKVGICWQVDKHNDMSKLAYCSSRIST